MKDAFNVYFLCTYIVCVQSSHKIYELDEFKKQGVIRNRFAF